jgi:hypothetical protein
VEQADPELLPEKYFEKPFNLDSFMSAVEAALTADPDSPHPA